MLFVLQATIAVVEDWEQGCTPTCSPSFPSAEAQSLGSIVTLERGRHPQESRCLIPLGRMSCPPASHSDDRHSSPSHNTAWKTHGNRMRSIKLLSIYNFVLQEMQRISNPDPPRDHDTNIQG